MAASQGFSQLERTISRHWATVATQNSSLTSPADAADLAIRVYSAVANSELQLIVIGSGRISDEVDLAANFGVISRDPGDGALFGDKPWTLLGNDAFMLAAIHSKKTVHLVAAKPLALAQLWNQKRHCPTILVREIEILRLANYTSTHTAEGIVFVPPKTPPTIKFSTLLKPIEIDPSDLLNYLAPKLKDDSKDQF